jgi:3-dehydroquinate synthase
MVHIQRFTVTYDYPVYFTGNVFAPDNLDLLQAIARKEPDRQHPLFVIVERAVCDARPTLPADIAAYVEHHRERLRLVAPPLVVDGGEAAKNASSLVSDLQERLHAVGLDRQSFVIVVGGGALLDAAGYAAGVVHRGLRVVRIPTTVLAQDDSGVGVKNGINAFGKKNFLGTFAPPFAVLNDVTFLRTLPRRETVAGMAEAVKVALIRDATFFEWLQRHAPRLATADADATAALVQHCAELHLDHIAASGDPFELGSARPLDFGHWVAHKLESLSAHRLRHGEAVAIGIAVDTVYSAASGLLDPEAVEPVLGLLETLGLRLWAPELERVRNGRPEVLDGLAEFREHLGGELTITLLKRIGEGVEVHEMDEGLILHALAELRARDAVR